MERVLITGGAGFIGSTVADRLAADGKEVVVYDNFSTGRREFLEELESHAGARVVEGDVLDSELLQDAMAGCDTVFHFAANADVRHGLEHPRRDLEQNTVGTFEVLEAMRAVGAERIAFASTGSIYGEPEQFPTPEDCPFPLQTSLYGASKLAGEGMISAYCHGFGFTGWVFRLVSILGERYTHGHVVDFYRNLKADPTHLTVLGDGRQEKSYVYVQDCVSAMLTIVNARGAPKLAVYNLGTDETITVDDSVATISRHMGVTPELRHTGGRQGWPGDSPLILLDWSKLGALGWEPQVSIPQAIERTLEWFDRNPEIVLGRGARA